jgi:hypothetical protein
MMIERRSLITGLVALVAAPAIVKVGSLMVCSPTEVIRPNTLLTINEITRESVRLFKASNRYLTLDDYAQRIVGPMADRLADQVAQDVLMQREHRSDLVFYDGEAWDHVWVDSIQLQDAQLRYNKERRSIDHVPQIPTALGVAALAVAAAPVVEQVLQKPVTRRFWSR